MSLRQFLKFTAVGRLLVIPYRFFIIALPSFIRQLSLMVRWTLTSNEHYNYTYHLTDLSAKYLNSFISVISGHHLSVVENYSRELEADEVFRRTLEQRTLQSPERHNCDVEPRYGRRLGWYTLVRTTKPKIVVETGVDRGLGTAVIAAALKRNTEEGFPGILYATDIVPTCGHLLAEPYKSYCRILIGDSVESLKQLQETVDIFIHDSEHSPEYEWAEFLAIEPRLHSTSLVLSDNSAQTSMLFDFANRAGKSFLYFQDWPKDHWWSGDGLGVAFVPGTKTVFQTEKHSSS